MIKTIIGFICPLPMRKRYCDMQICKSTEDAGPRAMRRSGQAVFVRVLHAGRQSVEPVRGFRI